jgi:hypothetical protein
MGEPVRFLHRHDAGPRPVTPTIVGSHASGATRARLGGALVLDDLGLDNLCTRGGMCCSPSEVADLLAPSSMGGPDIPRRARDSDRVDVLQARQVQVV